MMMLMLLLLLHPRGYTDKHEQASLAPGACVTVAAAVAVLGRTVTVAITACRSVSIVLTDAGVGLVGVAAVAAT